MIFDEVKNIDKYRDKLPKKTIEFFKDCDLTSLPVGMHIIEDTMIYANVDEYITIPWNDGRYEAHKKYIDIQWMISGEEIITIANINNLEIMEPYSEEKDIAFYHDTIRGEDIIISKGSFVILYPEDAHRPKIMLTECQKVKKIVVKIRL